MPVSFSTAGSAIGLLLLSVSTQALAQSAQKAPATSEAAQNGQLTEVVVTARRVSENLQIVPVSVTVVSAKDLVAQGTTNIEQLAEGTPALAVNPAAASKNSAIISLRGQVQNETLMTVDPSVGVYVDDIYYARAYSVLSDLLDVSGVEVLNGPQGTLYGRNTIGGAIKIATQRPDVNAPYGGYLRASYGNYNAVDATGAINMPIFPGKLALRYAGSYHNHDGYTSSYLVPVDPTSGRATSLTPTRRIGTDNENTYSHRLSLRWTPTDAVSLDLAGSIFHSDGNGALNVTLNGDVQNYVPGNGTPSVFSNSPQRQASFYSALTDVVPFDKTSVKTVDSTLQWKASNALTTKLILGYVESANDSSLNSNGTVNGSLSFLEFQPELVQHQRQYSAEYQMIGKLFDNHLDYLVGLYYFDEKGSEDAGNSKTYVFNSNVTNDFASDVHNKSESIFGHAVYALTDRLRVTGGLRYTRDTKSIDGHGRDQSMGQPGVCIYAPAPGIVTSTTNGGPCSFQRTDSFNYLTYEAGADYRATDAVFLYAKVANGYRGGGEQGRAVGGQSTTPFSPDQVVDFEVGAKSELFDRHLRFNISGYHTHFANVQQTNILFVNGRTTTVVQNQGNANINGFEAESMVRLGDRLTLSGGVGYVHFKYDAPGLVQIYSPEWTGHVSGVYVQPTSLGNLTGRLDYTNTGSEFMAGVVASTPQNQVPAHGLLNGRVSLDLADGLQLAVFGKNLTGEEYYRPGLVSAYIPGLFYGVHSVFVGPPRTYGVEASLKF